MTRRVVLTSPILDQVKQITSNVFGVPLESVAADSSPATIAAWDSIQHLTLVLVLEEQFGLHFSPDEIESMHDLGTISAMIQSKL
jgi:acyl carrier protein